MSNYKIKLACLNYDRTRAIHERRIKLDGVDIELTEITDVRLGFERMHHGEFDVSEFSTTELIFYTSRNKSSLIAIPVFPFRCFRHRDIYCSTSSGITGPESLNGKRIGFYGWVQTAAIWIRGLLEDEYGVSPKETPWYAAGGHHWDDEDDQDEIQPRNGAVINWLETKKNTGVQMVNQALAEGTLDAVGSPLPPASFLRGDGRVRRVIENFYEAERAYYEKTRIFPIMHILALKKSLAEEHPDLPRKLFAFFTRAKQLVWQGTRGGMSTSSMVWNNHYLEQERQLSGGDPWAYGLEQNRHGLEKLISYCYAQGVATRRIQPEELFDSSTYDLTEESVLGR